ncbi:FecR family protein [Dyadobacter sandarakinus]|uniref:FecR domain-containing protein n=1 Tax=Dyadobacter sandarakinus TaxID=2747268 RepID=A0ABX7I5Q9_9BACT|nr:FecR family protein [Dyadobacter sandarakinus]QRR01280.1 FecR domain-containing protein [Dyadobacter sandarakinus]
MNKPEDRLQHLFNRYYQGTASAAEQEEFMSLVRTGKYDALLEEWLKDSWMNPQESSELFSNEKSNAILDSILQASRQKPASSAKVFNLNWARYAAAAMLVLTGLGLWYHVRKSENPVTGELRVARVTDVKPGGNKALLTLSDGSAIALDKVKSGFVARQGNAEISKAQDGIFVYHAGTTGSSDKLSMNKIATPKGGQYQVQLPDGSKVWLNASSSIRFPSVFAGKERKVEITGEAYFEVAKDKSKPFRVSFNQSEVLVLGTTFNIMAYPEEGISKTTLVEGSVSIRHVGRKAQLKPGQQAAVLSSGQIKTRYTPVEEALAWKNGEFYFQDAGVEEVMRQLSRWYDVQISYEGKIPLKQFTGRISRQVNLSEITGMLRFAGVNCRLQDKQIMVEP